MYSSSPIPSYAIMDRRPTLGTMGSPQQQQQAWDPPTSLKQQQDTGMNYMIHHGYHVIPTSTSSPPQHHQHHLLPTQQQSSKQQMNRAVIPSKRAAQNRAAQKAFRQRRDQYVKDLEKKSKEMEHWKQEMDDIKNENQQLKSLVHQLEQRISSLAYQQVPDNEVSPALSSAEAVLSPFMTSPRSPSLPTLSAPSLGHHSSSPSPTTSPLMLTSISSPSSPSSSLSHHSSHSFLPISLRPHSFLPSKDDSLTIPSSSSSIPFVATSAINAAPSTHSIPPPPPPPNGHTPLFELDLDPFFDDDFEFSRMEDQLDFVGHTSGGQVLDDLFAMLQTRQRPQIPLQPPQQQQDDQPLPQYFMMDHVMPSQHSSSS